MDCDAITAAALGLTYNANGGLNKNGKAYQAEKKLAVDLTIRRLMQQNNSSTSQAAREAKVGHNFVLKVLGKINNHGQDFDTFMWLFEAL